MNKPSNTPLDAVPNMDGELTNELRKIHDRFHGRQRIHQEVARRSRWTESELSNVLREDQWLFEKEVKELFVAPQPTTPVVGDDPYYQEVENTIAQYKKDPRRMIPTIQGDVQDGALIRPAFDLQVVKAKEGEISVIEAVGQLMQLHEADKKQAEVDLLNRIGFVNGKPYVRMTENRMVSFASYKRDQLKSLEGKHE